MSILFFDTETTGLLKFKEEYTSENQPHLVQIACILDDLEGNTIEEYETIIRTSDVNIPPCAAEIHGITTAIANKSGILPETALGVFKDFAHKANRIVAHNIDFDIKVMKTAFYRARIDDFFTVIPTYCTKEKSTDILKLPGRYNSYKWPTLDEAYRVLVDVKGFEGAHNALVDVHACRKVYYALRGMDV